MQNKKYYIIYKTTNNVNGMIYIGQHTTDNLNDGYMGSGTYLKRDIKEYAKENFTTEILFEYDNFEEMDSKEAELVTEEFVSRSDTYNNCVGGNRKDYYKTMMDGSNLYKDNNNILNGTEGYGLENLLQGNDLMDKLKHLNKYDDYCNTLSNIKKGNTNWLGKRHNDKSIEKMKKTHTENKHQQGSKNSQYGKCWIYNLTLKESKRVYKDSEDLEYHLNNGWQLGRKMFKKADREGNAP